MGLLDDEEKKLIQTKEEKSKSGKKKSNAGVGRFAGLNKYSSLTEKYKKKKEKEKETTNQAVEISKPTKIAEKVKFKKPKVRKPTMKTKLIKNLVEKSNELEERLANREQTDSNKTANREQIESNLVANSKQTDSNKVSKEGSKLNTHLKPVSDHRTVIGNERNILYIIYTECLKLGELETPPMPLRVFSSITNLNTNIIKNIIYRLKKKNLIHVVDRRAGRGGWSRYGISKELYQSFQRSNPILEDNIEERLAKRVAKEVAITSSSSSVILNEKNTTTIQPRSIKELPIEWQQLNLTNLDEIGFKDAQLIQIHNSGANYNTILDSLEALRHDIVRKKIPGTIRSPLGMVMSVLRVKKEPYFSYDPDYVSESDKAIEEMMKVQKKRLLKKQKQREELFKLKFEDWRSGLSSDEVKKILPSFVDPNGQGAETSLIKYFQSLQRTE